jgi:hypothetical protein
MEMKIKVNISEFVKCFQKLNDRFYVTCKDRECKEVLLNDFSRFEIRGIIYLMRNAHPLTWESRKNYIDITLYNLPFEIKPDSVSPRTSVFGLLDDKRPSKRGKPVADPKSSSVLSGRTSEGLGRLLAKPRKKSRR